MTLSDIDAVRLKAADRSTITREQGVGDGEASSFKLGHDVILSVPDIQVRVNNVLIVSGYTVDYNNGIVLFDTAPNEGDQIEFVYYWSIFSDEQIQYFIDDSASISIAAAQVLLAIAADAAKVAQRQSLAGGGGLGAVTIDTSVAARELRAAAKAIIDTEVEVTGNEPAEGLTEINWTAMNYQMGIGQRIVRGG